MKINAFCRVLLCAMLAAVLAAGVGCAYAQEELLSDRVELFSEGGFPVASPRIAAFAADDFDSYMYEMLQQQAERIDVLDYGMTLETFRTAYRGLLNRHPELFYVSGGYSYYSSGDGTITAILPTYVYSGDELTRMQSVFDAGVSAVVKYANQADTTVGKLLRASDYLCANYEYDETYTISSPELFFEQGTGVCQAYMLAFGAVCDALGVPFETATSDAMNHTWNLVYVDGDWYHVDVTWNDPTSDAPLRAMHNNLLLSDAGITNAGSGHHSWVASVTADSTKYDEYFWTNLRHPAPMVGDVVYYVQSVDGTTERMIRSFDLETGDSQDVLSYDYGYGTYYIGYNPIWVTEDSVYYAAQHELYAVAREGGTPALLYTTGDNSLKIFYLYKNGSSLKASYGSDPSTITDVVSIPIDTVRSVEIDRALLEVQAGASAQLSAVVSPEMDEPVALAWSSSDDSIASVDESGLVSGLAVGAASVTARYSDSIADTCAVIVHSDSPMIIPESAKSIGAQALVGIAAQEIVLPEGLTAIGEKTFADCAQLRLVNLPQSVTQIAADAFAGCENVTLICAAGSAGEAFAAEQGIPCVVTPDAQ